MMRPKEESDKIFYERYLELVEADTYNYKDIDDEKEELTKIYTKLMSEAKLASLFLFSSYFNLIIEAQLSNQ